MQKESLILSIDGGASSSKAGVITKNSKEIIREYVGKAIYTEKKDIKETLLNLKEILVDVKTNFKEIAGVVIGISGMDTQNEKKIYTPAVSRLVKIFFKEA
ncbi:hypothetical protein KA001_01760, partial [Patescibacteria group bacterium]|nr:hypothetical protein [Patescibacteria group bacterium]